VSADPDVDVVRRTIESFSLDRPGGFYAACDPGHVEIVPLRAALEDTVYRGPDAPREFVEAMGEAWESMSFADHEVRRIGERVLVLASMRARSRDAGIDLDFDIGAVFRLRGGRITHLHTYPDPAEAVAAAEREGERHEPA
jgi:ketosteroid isomerase-like protein